MEITIRGTAKEIASLVFELQGWRKEDIPESVHAEGEIFEKEAKIRDIGVSATLPGHRCEVTVSDLLSELIIPCFVEGNKTRRREGGAG